MMTVLVLGDEFDPSVDRVVLSLRARDVPVARIDLGWFPTEMVVDTELKRDDWAGTLCTANRTVSLDDLRSVWFRGPTVFRFADGLSGTWLAHAEREARLALGGLLSSLPVAWMNQPQSEADAAYKPHQLASATRSGLTVPSTLITNDASAVRRFVASARHGVVTKVLGANVLHDEGTRKVAHTRMIRDSDLADLVGVELTAHLFQEWVPKSYEVRLVVVGDRMFAVGIRTDDPDAYIDWRANYSALEYFRVATPEPVARAVRSFMATSRLAFSALDFVVTPEGRWVFLESNPGGQYGWLMTTLGTEISDAIVDWLARGRRA